jgi:hypothetical protein
MIVARNDRTIRDVGQSVAIGDKHFEVVKKLVYLGSLMTPTNDGIRKICGLKYENGVYRRRYDHELDKEFDSPNALNVTKTNRLRCDGQMIRRPKDLPQKALFRAKPNGRRNQGRPKPRSTDGVKSDSLALGVRDWTHCAQDRLSQILVVVPHK